MTIFAELKNTMLADGLADADLMALSGIGELLLYYKNDVIFRENEIEDSIYVLLEGKVAIERWLLPNQQASHRLIQHVRRGQLFGEMGFIEKRVRSATAIAKSRVRLVRFNFQELENLIAHNEKLGLNLFRTIAGLLSRRLRRMNDQWIRIVESAALKEFEYY